MKKIIIAILLCFFGVSAYAYNPANLPEEMLFSDAIEIFDVGDITGGYILSSEDSKLVNLTLNECKSFYSGCSQLVLKRGINPAPFSGLSVNLYTDNVLHTFYINSGVQLGLFGDSNYICYQTDEYNDAIMTIHSIYNSSEKSNFSNININSRRDFLKLPDAQWAQPQIIEAAKNSLLPYEFVNIYGKNITREEFCKLLANMIAVSKNYSSIPDLADDLNIDYSDSYFEDCNADFVAILHKLGIISGKSKTNFEPHSPLTREEAAVILTRTALFSGDFPSGGYLNFSDNKMISPWAYDSVLWVCGYGIMSGISENEFSPKGYYTTEQAITTINRIYKILKELV